MPGPTRTFNNVPDDPFIQGATRDFLQFLLSNALQSQSSLFPPAAPAVTTISHPNAVQVVWNEVANATQYAVFETTSASAPAGVPFATVPANIGAASNSVLRPNINDTTTRFYSVQAISKNGNRGLVSTAVAGVALSGAAPVIPVSQTPVSQSGSSGLVGGGVGGGGGIIGKKGGVPNF